MFNDSQSLHILKSSVFKEKLLKRLGKLSNFRDIKERHELHPIIRILEENHLIIQRRFAQFKLKLKNGLTEQVLNDYQL